MAYFEVVAKCGHVGRNNYYRGKFYVKAESAQAASKRVLSYARVKKHHKDAIIACEKICEEEYNLGLKDQEKNPYFNATNHWDQKAFWEEIKEDVFPETERQFKHRKRVTNQLISKKEREEQERLENTQPKIDKRKERRAKRRALNQKTNIERNQFQNERH